jgi:hypothetical protein
MGPWRVSTCWWRRQRGGGDASEGCAAPPYGLRDLRGRRGWGASYSKHSDGRRGVGSAGCVLRSIHTGPKEGAANRQVINPCRHIREPYQQSVRLAGGSQPIVCKRPSRVCGPWSNMPALPPSALAAAGACLSRPLSHHACAVNQGCARAKRRARIPPPLPPAPSHTHTPVFRERPPPPPLEAPTPHCSTLPPGWGSGG